MFSISVKAFLHSRDSAASEQSLCCLKAESLLRTVNVEGRNMVVDRRERGNKEDPWMKR